jgi:hypothetical protein
MLSTEDRENHLFIVRVWREGRCRDGAWRGSAQHVTSGRSIVSADLDELTDFIRVRLAAQSEPEIDG